MSTLSQRATEAARAFVQVDEFYFASRYAERRNDSDICDFTFGNPHDPALGGIVEAIRQHAVPQNKDWFAYKTSEVDPQTYLAGRMSDELGLAFAPADIALTTGAFAAIMVAFHLLLDAGDEAVINEPAWFCYDPMLRIANAAPRKVALSGERFDLDINAIERAIGPRTRIVVVNTPHNPTGRIYSEAELSALADVLERASARHGRRIYLLSDEPYRRLRFDGRGFVTPASIYPWTMISYSYGKVLLAPGQRLGYLALSPLMPEDDRAAFQRAMFAAQMALGWCFPNAVMQFAVPDLENLSIDIDALARRRDRLSGVLQEQGCSVLAPEGTFYLWSRWPAGDPEDLWNRLADHGVFVLPGSMMNVPDCFRISLTASDAMVERSIAGFAAALA